MVTNMLAQERYEYIIEKLNINKLVKVKNLSKELHVTTETIRRDLENLEKDGYLKRVYGGASLVNFDTMQDAFNGRILIHPKEKEEIAKQAINYINEYQSIVIDYSTTCLALAKEIKKHFDVLTIITNSIEVMQVLSDKRSFKLIFCGGMYNFDERSCFGEDARRMVNQLNIDISFIGVGGISLHEGLTETFYDGVDMLKSFIKAAQRTIVLIDSSKFDKVALIKVCDLTDISMVITDSSIKTKVIEKYRDADIEICYPENCIGKNDKESEMLSLEN